MQAPSDAKIGIVVIGRNEGQRLARCLVKAASQCSRLVYVDSASTDSSCDVARTLGIPVVQLSGALSAGRARNAGARDLLDRYPDVAFIQFVDGDCELVPGWLDSARDWLVQHPDAAVVCGRRRERLTSIKLLHRFCDLEWDTPVGQASACGGDAMIRARAFFAAGGFHEELIAGEEPELCHRLRQQGWGIHRLPVEMTQHDGGIEHWGQWWRRCRRAGYAYVSVAAMHWREHPPLWRREVLSVLGWTLGMSLLVTLLSIFAGWHALILLLGYPVLWARMALRSRSRYQIDWPTAGLYALALLLGKFAELTGILDWLWHRLRHRPAQIIEYKEVR